MNSAGDLLSVAEDATIGPVLLSRGVEDGRHRLLALIAQPGDEAPRLTATAEGEDEAGGRARLLTTIAGRRLFAIAFSLPADRPGAYAVETQASGTRRFEVAPPARGALSIAYVSCNGREKGDGDRAGEERNALWTRLWGEHRESPFALLLQGGDQIYADEVLQAHPAFVAWSEAAHGEWGAIAFDETCRQAALRFYAERYLSVLSQEGTAELSARVPSVMMWDDHDIMDGWGSLPEAMLDSPVGRGLFAAARETFLLFQLGAEGPPPGIGLDPTGASLSLALRYPGLSILAPDLRSERRPHRVMGEAGWTAFERSLEETPPGDRVLVMSSVPGLGPRLSWVERLGDLALGGHRYEDDLRDQWQSRSHRAEWTRFLKALATFQEAGRGRVTLVSGEIHLATRARMRLKDGSDLEQFIASGISHPAPNGAYPMLLGLLARLGESPLPGRPIRMAPIPGRRTIYTAERNYLVLTRTGRDWSARWETEKGGPTPPVTF
ncbi:hypothetical protein ASG48_16340 [Aurantimonas sp. Leaf443]|nr:hypothetical protein ASG48_16340 [Aurantimonas sp. Leaf443]